MSAGSLQPPDSPAVVKTTARWRFDAADEWSRWAFRSEPPTVDASQLESAAPPENAVDPRLVLVQTWDDPAPESRLRSLLTTCQVCGVSTVLHLLVLLTLAAVTAAASLPISGVLLVAPPAKNGVAEKLVMVQPPKIQAVETAPAVLAFGSQSVEPIEITSPMRAVGTASPASFSPHEQMRSLLASGAFDGSAEVAATGASKGLLPESEAGPGEAAGATFFGIQAEGNDFVFVVDCSLSMLGAKWTDACRELSSAIDRLAEGKRFYVIFFDGESHRMFNDKDYVSELLPANETNMLKLRHWLTTVRLGNFTSPCLSMQFAHSLNPDAIYLLSDGEFSDPTAPWLRKNNKVRLIGGERRRPVAVHTIGFRSRKGQKMLSRIARENDGVYRYVE